MPNKPKRPCRYRSCPNLTNNLHGYCDEHANLALKERRKYNRSSETKKRYNYQWRKLRARFLKQNPLCTICKQQGRYTAATEVHHIKPLGEGGNNELSNLMPLCKSCHSRITIKALNKKNKPAN